MAVSLSFEICSSSDCKSLAFTETTGAYSSTNTNGWGSPNKLTSDAETAVLEVTIPGDITYTFDLFAESPAFPTSDEDQKFIINAEDIGGVSGDKIPDGLYLFRYTVGRTTATAFTYTQQIQQLLYCNIKCCVYSMFADIDEDCSCSSKKIEKALKSFALYKSLVAAAGCGQVNRFANLLKILGKLCKNTNCNCN
jgi:hypothetical protein